MTKPPKEILEKFLLQVEILSSINFPEIAKSQDLNWFKDIKPCIEKQEWFRNRLEELLEGIKFGLVNGLLEVARVGKTKFAPSPEVSYVKAVVEYIDSGVLLGVKPKDVQNAERVERSPEEEAAHRKRLGLEEDE